MNKATLKSIGSYVPEKVLTNFDLEKMVETSDEWITKRTGIKNRHIAQKDELASDMGTKAALIAISRAGLEIKDIDAVICGTITPDYFCMPSTACKIAANLGLYGVTAFDISAACSGFVYLLNVAKALVESGANKNVLIVGAEKFSSVLDWSDRSTCVLFGDGAGAGVVSRDEENYIIDIHTASDGTKGDLLATPGFATKYPMNDENIKNRMNFLHMSGNEVFKIAVRTLIKDVQELMQKNNISTSDIDLFIPHQANLRIIEAVKEKLGFDDKQCVLTVGKYGNTGSASIPMAINDAYELGILKNGSLILLDAFGGGFTWGSALLKFGGH